MQVHGLRAIHMQLTSGPLTEVYVQFVATYITEPIISNMVPLYIGVTVNISRIEHAIPT